MRQLTPAGQQKVTELAQRYGISTDAVRPLLHALVNSQGAMAQCEHRELGGGGQWMRGGMSMRGAMGNQALKTTVEGLCLKLSRLLTPDLLQAQLAGGQMQSQEMQFQQRNSMSQEDRGKLFYVRLCLLRKHCTNLASPEGEGFQLSPSETLIVRVVDQLHCATER
jgi:hypothetical protein